MRTRGLPNAHEGEIHAPASTSVAPRASRDRASVFMLGNSPENNPDERRPAPPATGEALQLARDKRRDDSRDQRKRPAKASESARAWMFTDSTV